MSNMVREIRQAKGLSCERLARQAEISATDLSKIERGLRRAYPGWRRRIASALQTPEAELFPEAVAQ